MLEKRTHFATVRLRLNQSKQNKRQTCNNACAVWTSALASQSFHSLVVKNVVPYFHPSFSSRLNWINSGRSGNVDQSQEHCQLELSWINYRLQRLAKKLFQDFQRSLKSRLNIREKRDYAFRLQQMQIMRQFRSVYYWRPCGLIVNKLSVHCAGFNVQLSATPETLIALHES